MKAIIVTKPFNIQISDVPDPMIQQPDDVIIRVTSGGICGSDIGIWNGTNSLATYPRLIGHEFGGIVEETGPAVTGIKPGDKVAVDPVISCGHCYACRIGRHNVCSSLEVMGVHRDGGFAEYVKAPAQNIHKFHTDFSESLLGLAEPFTIGMQVNNRAQISAADNVLVMGAGPIGITVMEVAKSRGARVMMTDLVPERLEKARSFGADETVLVSEENLEARVGLFTGGEGAPVIVDTVCQPFSFAQAVHLACPAGRIVVLSLRDTPAELIQAEVTKKELSILGSRLNCNCFDEVIDSFENGSLHPEHLMTHTRHFTEIEAALDEICNHPQNVLKTVLHFS